MSRFVREPKITHAAYFAAVWLASVALPLSAYGALRPRPAPPPYLTREQVRGALNGRYEQMQSRHDVYMERRTELRRRAAQNGTNRRAPLPRDPIAPPPPQTLQ